MREAKKILSSNFIIFVGTIAGGLFSYLFNMLAGRWLGPAQYGEFSALMSLLTILSVGGGTVLTVTMRYSGELCALQNYQALRRLFIMLSQYVFILGVLLICFGAIFIKPIAGFLAIDHLWPLAIVLLNFICGFLIMVNRGVLQGSQKFSAISFISVLEMGLRLAIGAALIKIGMELGGAMLGVVLATAATYVVAFVPLSRVLRQEGKVQGKFKFDKKEMVSYSWPTLVATLLLVVSLNMDILLVKHYFEAEQAGLYAAISTIAKIVVFATGPMVGVMFPMISEQRVKGDKHYRIFLFSLLLTLVMALVIQGIYTVMPGKIITLLYGTQYAKYYWLLPLSGLTIVLYSLMNVMVNYFLSIKNFMFLPMFMFVLVAQVGVIATWHPSLEAVVKVFISTQGLLFILMFGYYLLTKKDQLVAYARGKYEES